MMTTRARLRMSLLALVLALMGTCTLFAAPSKTTVTLWHHWDGDRAKYVQHILDEFMAANPDVLAEQLFTSTGGAVDKLATMLAAGAAPEVVMVRSTYANKIIRLGGLTPLDALIRQDKINTAMFFPADVHTFQADGQLYALPVMSGVAWTNLLFYNKRLMAEAGLPGVPPTTWTEWRQMSLRMMRRDTTGRIVSGGSEMPPSVWVAPWNNTPMWTADWKKATADNERMVETMTFLKDLLEAQYGSYGEYTAFNGSGFTSAFMTDRQGFSVRNSSSFAHMPNTPVDWGAALAPRNDAHADTEPTGLVLSTWGYGIPNTVTGAKLDAAWKLLKWLTVNEQGAGWFARVQGRPSAVIRYNQHPEYRRTNPYWDVVIRSTEHVAVTPPVSVEIMNGPLSKILTGQVHMQQGTADAQRVLQNELDQFWSK